MMPELRPEAVHLDKPNGDECHFFIASSEEFFYHVNYTYEMEIRQKGSVSSATHYTLTPHR
jgi:hypothetical protein